MEPTNPHVASATMSTTDYDDFHFINMNRELNRGHIEAIKKSIEENGNFTAFSPVLVNESFHIIDGQHRFVACKELGVPVFFVVAPNTSIREARRMNILNKNWSTVDYAHSYREEGIPAYVHYSVLRGEYPDLGHSIILMYMRPDVREGIHAHFRSGTLQFDANELPATRERLDKLEQCADISPMFRVKTLAKALLLALQVDGYDHTRMLAKLDELRGEIVVYQSSTENLRLLERIYNSGLMAQNRIRFF